MADWHGATDPALTPDDSPSTTRSRALRGALRGDVRGLAATTVLIGGGLIGVTGPIGCATDGPTERVDATTTPGDDRLAPEVLRRDAEYLREMNASLEEAAATGSASSAATVSTGGGVDSPEASTAASIDWNAPAGTSGSVGGSGGLTAPDSLASLRGSTPPIAPGALSDPVERGGEAYATTAAMTADTEAPPRPAAPSTFDRDRAGDLSVALTSELWRVAADSDLPLPQLLTIASLSIADPDRPFDAHAFPGLTAREREVLDAFHQFSARMGQQLRDEGSPEAAADVVSDLEKVLRGDPTLEIRRVELCTHVEVFGKFTPYAKNVFLAGSGQEVVVYFELDHFTSVQNSGGEWVTDLSVEFVIYDELGRTPVWRTGVQPAIDRNLNRRRDFFVNQLLVIPRSLSVGRYVLKVMVRDENGLSEAEDGVEFTVVADARMLP